jgi:hypothetical protein
VESIALWLGIAGLALIIAGILFVFLAALNVIKEARREGENQKKAVRAEAFDCAEAIEKLLEWLKNNVPARLLPGFGLIVSGIILFGIALGVEAASGTNSTEAATL